MVLAVRQTERSGIGPAAPFQVRGPGDRLTRIRALCIILSSGMEYFSEGGVVREARSAVPGPVGW